MTKEKRARAVGGGFVHYPSKGSDEKLGAALAQSLPGITKIPLSERPAMSAAAKHTAHTLGLWRVDFEKHYSGAEKAGQHSRAIMAGRKVICAVLCKWRAPDPQSDADARLIAAAPELLAVANKCAEYLLARNLGQPAKDLADNLCNTIAKAEGRA